MTSEKNMLHDIREKQKLSLTTYVVIDSIHKLSTTNRDYPYCTMSKPHIASFLGLSRATIFRSIDEALKKGLIEKTPEGFLRTTRKWIDLVEIYSIKAGR